MATSAAGEQVALVTTVAKDPIERKKFIDDPIGYGRSRDIELDAGFAVEAARRLAVVQGRIDALGGSDFSETEVVLRPQFLLAVLAVVAVVTAVVDAATHVYHALTHKPT